MPMYFLINQTTGYTKKNLYETARESVGGERGL